MGMIIFLVLLIPSGMLAHQRARPHSFYPRLQDGIVVCWITPESVVQLPGLVTNSPGAEPVPPGTQAAPTVSSGEPITGRIPIPDHELLERIGAGAYGEVWSARNVFGELRAVKLIYRSRFNDPRPFQREIEGIQRFEPISRSHPSQLAVLHVGKNDDFDCFFT
jgi:hypothetical protein